MAGTTKANNAIIALSAGKRSVRRKLLMAGVMALAPVGSGVSHAAQALPAGCLPASGGPTITCTGDQANGLEVHQGNTLIVKSLTSSIGSSDRRLDDVDAGIDFDTYSNYKLAADSKLDPAAVTLDADTTGTSGIWVAYASGIEVENYGSATTTVKSKGDINVFDDEGYGVSGIAVFARTGKVDVTSASNITLTADGGEGESAGIMVASYGDITISNTGTIATTNASMYDQVAGLHARSQGMYGYDGGSGSAGMNPGDSGSSGQAGETGGAGGDITIVSSGKITGSGQGAGIVAETAGGQGGRGGQGGKGADGDTSSVGGNGGNGGAGGDGGRGGDVAVTASGAISQWGSWVTGIFASSTGGSGGSGGEPGLAGSGFEGSAATRGADGNGGDGGGVTVVSSANIAVTGEDATGIRAESSGGWAPEGGWEGSGNTVHVTNSGMITTNGPGATGISVASLGGEMGGATVDNSGTISNAHVTSGTSNNRVVTTAGVAFEGGSDNVLNNSGTIDSTGIFDKYGPRFAVTAEGYTAVNNTGTINGSIDLIGLSPAVIDTLVYHSNSVSSYADFLALLHMDGNSFNNDQGGTFNAGILVALGEGSSLTNAGIMATGGDGYGDFNLGDFQVSSLGTVLVGNFNQTATGQLNIGLNVADNTASGLYVLGDAALAGTIAVTPTTLSTRSIFTPLVSTVGIDTESDFPIVPTAGLTNNGVALSASPALHASLEWQPLEAASTTTTPPDLRYTSVSLASSGIDFGTVKGLTATEQLMADQLQQKFNAEHPEMHTDSATTDGSTDKLFLALLSPMELAQYKAALDKLTSSATAGAGSGGSSSTTSNQFTNAMLSCRQATGAYAYIREGQCSWAQLKQRVTDRSLTVDAPGSRTYVTSLSAGVQKSIGGGWFAGFGLGYAHDDIGTTDNTSSSGNAAMAGVVVKYAPGPVSLALALDAGMGWNDNKRKTVGNDAVSSNSQNHFGAQLRAAYLIDHGLWYAKPMVDLNVTMLNIGGYTETGGVGNLTVMDSKTTILSVSPAIEFGGQFKLANGALVRPYSKVGLTFFGDTSIGTTAHLVGTTGDFSVSSTGDRTLVDLTSGLDILATDGMTLRLNTESHFGATTRDLSASAKVGWSF